MTLGTQADPVASGDWASLQLDYVPCAEAADWERDTEFNGLVDSLIEAQFRRNHAELDGVGQQQLLDATRDLRGCLPVIDAYKDMKRVDDQRFPRWTNWDRADDLFAGLLGIVIAAGFLLGLGAGAVAIAQWVRDWSVPWRWFVKAALVLLISGLTSLALVVFCEWRSGKKDEEFLKSSKWPARQRAFETAVELFVFQPALRSAMTVDFRPPSRDYVLAGGRALSTTPYPYQLVKTDTYRRVSIQISRPDGATIGIRGSRGAGKTDLVRALCGRQDRVIVGSSQLGSGPLGSPSSDPREEAATHDGLSSDDDTGDDVSSAVADPAVLGVFISAPASLDEHAFLRRVALLLCERVLERDDGQSTAPTSLPRQRRLGALAIAAAVLGATIVWWPNLHIRVTHLGWTLVVVGLLVAAGVTLLPRARYRSLRGGSRKARAKKMKKDTASTWSERANRRAADFQRRLRYTQTESRSAEGSVGYGA
jgi:hypothetical protein